MKPARIICSLVSGAVATSVVALASAASAADAEASAGWGSEASSSETGKAPAEAERKMLGLKFDLRFAYALPMGSFEKSPPGVSNITVSDIFAHGIGIGLGAQWAFDPHVSIGLFGQITPLSNGPGGTPLYCGTKVPMGAVVVTCSGSQLRFGLDAHYMFMPDKAFDPWIGVGVGYESLHLTRGGDQTVSSFSYTGYELAHLSLGADILIVRHAGPGKVGVGPVIDFALGQFTGHGPPITYKALHEWLAFGLRGTYDL